MNKFLVPRGAKNNFVDGITTPQSYLVLRTWEGSGAVGAYHAAIQPWIRKLKADSIFVGGKLRLRFNNSDKPTPISLLREKYQYIPWYRSSWARLSVMFGQIYIVDPEDLPAFLTQDFGYEVLTGVEKLLHTRFEEKADLAAIFNSTLKLQGPEALNTTATRKKVETVFYPQKAAQVFEGNNIQMDV